MTDFVEKFVSTRVAMELVGVKSVNTLRKLIREKAFPSPYQILEGRNSYSLREVQGWIEQQKNIQQQRHKQFLNMDADCDTRCSLVIETGEQPKCQNEVIGSAGLSDE